MTTERGPVETVPLIADQTETVSWALARERLADPELGRTSWLATVRPDGRPHLMPIISFWIDDALYFIAGEGTRKARNLARDERCVIGTGSMTLPSMDIVVEGRAEALTEEAGIRHIAGILGSHNWPLEVRGDQVYGPHAPTAGPPPYSIFRMIPSKAFGLPGMFGMDQFDRDELPKPSRWDFSPD